MHLHFQKMCQHFICNIKVQQHNHRWSFDYPKRRYYSYDQIILVIPSQPYKAIGLFCEMHYYYYILATYWYTLLVFLRSFLFFKEYHIVFKNFKNSINLLKKKKKCICADHITKTKILVSTLCIPNLFVCSSKV